MSSSGVFIRLFMVVFPSILFVLLGKNLQINKNQIILWKSISFYSLSLIFLLIISPSSTIIDRLTLYALPIMIFVLSNLPELKFAKLSRKYINLSVVLMAFLIQYVWLNFADNSIKFSKICLNIFHYGSYSQKAFLWELHPNMFQILSIS